MLAERYTTEDMKKDVNDLFTVIKEAGNKGPKATYFIRVAYDLVRRYKDIEDVKNRFEQELAVLEITDQAEKKFGMRKITEENTIAMQAADKVLSFLAKYERKSLLIVLDSVLRLKDELVTENSLARK